VLLEEIYTEDLASPSIDVGLTIRSIRVSSFLEELLLHG
jgi:hypothetical protein